MIGSEASESVPGYVEFPAALKMKCHREPADIPGSARSKVCYFPGDVRGDVLAPLRDTRAITP